MFRFKASPLLFATCLGLQINTNLVTAQSPSSNFHPFPIPNSQFPIPHSQFPISLQSSTPNTCPSDVNTLTAHLLRDLPGYANRVIQRARRLNRTVDVFSYVLVAGRPEFEPLTLGPGQYTDANSAANVEPPAQVFFTTLERQYQRGRAIESQHYHWLFLTQTPDGWRLAMMFSRFGSSSRERPPTPPRESSGGTIGQAVNNWLRDCRAGNIRPS